MHMASSHDVLSYVAKGKYPMSSAKVTASKRIGRYLCSCWASHDVHD
jgi:hypothetical protein